MFKNLPGFRDFYPEDCAVRNHIFRTWRLASRQFAFHEFDGPTLEPLELFTTKSGDEIVGQLFNFTDKGERNVTLRAEMTPTLARMVGAKVSGMRKPIKWFNISENFRYERPQKGRLRSFYQYNGDILGESSPKADAEVIALMSSCLTSFGLRGGDFVIRLSDRTLWIQFIETFTAEEATIHALLSIIDKMERQSDEKTLELLKPLLAENAESFLKKARHLMEIRSVAELREAFPEASERLDDWQILIDELTSLGLSDFLKIDLSIVRGLAYYTGFVFEAFQLKGTARALAGGGRYDHLVEKLGGPSTPAVGFAMGDVTVRDFLEQEDLLPKYHNGPDIFIITESGPEREAALHDTSHFRMMGYATEYSLKGLPLGKQFKEAAALNAKYALVYGTEELASGEITVKNLAARSEEKIPRGALPDFLKDHLG